MAGRTLLVGLAHPDDEMGAAGAILAQRAQGDRVVLVWLTQGSRTAAFGDLPKAEVARRRREFGYRAGEILDVETRFLDYHDTRLAATPDAANRVAQLVAEIRPDAVLTWGEAWIRGMRHPDHQAAGKIFRDAVVLARIASVVAPVKPHREWVPIFTYRDVHSTLPAVVIDIEPYLEKILELGQFYFEHIGFGDRSWIEQRLGRIGEQWGLKYAEVFDAWESKPGTFGSLLPAERIGPAPHPDRDS